MLQQQQQLQHQLSQQHREQQQQQGVGEGNNDLDDIRRLRETIAQRRGRDGRRLGVSAASGATDTLSESDLEARKELIRQNLFVRQIDREESVIDLLRLLAISRGGDGSVLENEDEELGRINGHATSARESTSNPAIKVWEENIGEKGSTSLSNAELNEPLPPTAVAPSAPPLSPPAEDTTTSIVTNVTPKTMTAVGRLWRSFSRRQQSDPNIAIDSSQQHQAPQQQANNNISDNICISATHNSSPHHSNRTECSICLEQYSPNDIIAWAKDGGDTPPTSSSGTTPTSYYTGCDHIFHKECLVAWLLQGHDECPLCRRRVIHADANVRFAGWEER
jgi:hypothetical protein